ncbi:MAG: choline TMA-lyase-activating enzyme [Clostridiales Family XIII bacterium]|jgi:pyruvate formate lyase activating enzyme|nr:choline TMA-lyase-activating enzyme [Clostridiales Family XIII bacterium]
MERYAFIFNKQKYNMYDGPGVRTLIFFKGCPLRCKWCSNPEGLIQECSIFFKKNNCTSCGNCVNTCPQKIHSIDHNKKHVIDRGKTCIGCKACEEVCFEKALQIAGARESISDMLDYIKEDISFYHLSEGGLTLGGGEALMQKESALGLLMACKQNGINTAIETSGYAAKETLLSFAEQVDLFLYDVKGFDSDEHFNNTGVRNEVILDNLEELLRRKYNVKVRMPLLKDVNTNLFNIEKTADFLLPFSDGNNFKGVDLLPYHKLGVNKYEQLGLEYKLDIDPVMSDEELEKIEKVFKIKGIEVSIVRH